MDLSSFFDQVNEYDDTDGSQDDAKRAAAQQVLDLVEPGMKLGLGTGSTVEFFLQGLARRIAEGLDVAGVPTSKVTERRCQELGIPLLGAPQFPELRTDLCVDGADRVDLTGCLIKGGGGALFREKLVALYSDHVCILVDPSKIRTVFDDSFAIPVECLPFGIDNTVSALADLGCQATQRSAAGQPYITDNGNAIVDCQFTRIPDPTALALRMSGLTGVVEAGLFCDLLDRLVVGFKDGTAACWPRATSAVS
jgi:ribose 5-phosphate isomerase A